MAGLSSVRVVPSLAVLFLRFPHRREVGRLPPFAERSFLLAPVALALPAGPPVLINTDAGLGCAERATVEAARAMGMTAPQVFLKVRLPLAAAVLLAGVRIAAVSIISLASVTAWVNAGGLGTLLFDGITQDYPSMILAGTLAIVGIALAADLLFRGLERLTPAARARGAGGTGRPKGDGSAAVP